MADEQEKDIEQGGLFRNKERFLKIIVAVGLVGIGLIFLSNIFTNKKDSGQSQEQQQEPVLLENANTYKEQLSQELGNMVASIEGAGRTKLMLTLDGTIRNLYATDSDIQSNDKNTADEHQNNEKKTYITVRNNDGSEQALTIGQVMPNVRGVLVVCEGGDREDVEDAVKSAISAAVHLSPSRICVLKMSE